MEAGEASSSCILAGKVMKGSQYSTNEETAVRPYPGIVSEVGFSRVIERNTPWVAREIAGWIASSRSTTIKREK